MKDLKERGSLEDTLVILAVKFSPAPFGQSRTGQPNAGRDHFGRALSWWMAGGGVNAVTTYGATDEYGWNITESPIHVHDMQATIIQLAGINHTKLTYRYQGREFRLTDMHGHVQHGILA